MLLVFCAYIGYALRYFMPNAPQQEKKDEEKGEIKIMKNKKKIRIKEPTTTANRKTHIFIFLLVLAETIASQLSMIGFTLVGSGVSN